MMETPLRVFCCYAREDKTFLEKLRVHLTPMQHEGLIEMQADIDVNPGDDWKKKINDYLDTSNIILLLVSSDFLASNYCYSVEMEKALERHTLKKACVIPIIIRPAYWINTPLSVLQMLPTDAVPITHEKWHTEDDAFVDVVKGIAKKIEILTRPEPPAPNPVPPSEPPALDRPEPPAPNPVPSSKPPTYRTIKPNLSRRKLIIGVVALSLVLLGGISGGGYLFYEYEHYQHQSDPPTGFTVTSVTLQDGQPMQHGYAIVNADIPLAIQGSYAIEGSGMVWVVLHDDYGNYYLQSPQVQFNGGDKTWSITNIRPLHGITTIDFVAVTPDGNGTFQQKVSNANANGDANGDFGAFTQLPQDSLILHQATIPINTSQISP